MHSNPISAWLLLVLPPVSLSVVFSANRRGNIALHVPDRLAFP